VRGSLAKGEANVSDLQLLQSRNSKVEETGICDSELEFPRPLEIHLKNYYY